MRNFLHLCTDDSKPRSVAPNWEFYWGFKMQPVAPTPEQAHLLWNEWTATYVEKPLSPEEEFIDRKQHRFLLPGFFEQLTHGERERLAAEEDVFFVKTHNLPLDHYFPGEKVLHVVRHPGPTCHSYFRLLNRQFEDAGDIRDVLPVTLEQVIRGEVDFGSWSEHSRQWLDLGEQLGDAYRLLRYEQMLESEDACSELIIELTGLPFRSREKLDFAEKRILNQNFREGRGTNEGYSTLFTPQQIALLSEYHGPMMARLDYEPESTPATKFPQAEVLGRATERLVAEVRSLQREKGELTDRITRMYKEEAALREVLDEHKEIANRAILERSTLREHFDIVERECRRLREESRKTQSLVQEAQNAVSSEPDKGVVAEMMSTVGELSELIMQQNQVVADCIAQLAAANGKAVAMTIERNTAQRQSRNIAAQAEDLRKHLERSVTEVQSLKALLEKSQRDCAAYRAISEGLKAAQLKLLSQVYQPASEKIEG